MRNICRGRRLSILYHSGWRTGNYAVWWDIVGHHTVGPDDATLADSYAFHNPHAEANPSPLADPDGSYFLSVRIASCDSLFHTGRVAVIVRDLTVACDQHVVLEDHLLIAGDGYVVSKKDAVSDSQSRPLAEFARDNGETAAKPDVVSYVKEGMALNGRHSAQSQVFSD